MRPVGAQVAPIRPLTVDAGLTVLAVAVTVATSRGPVFVLTALAVVALALPVRRGRPVLVTAVTVGAELAAVPVLLSAGVPPPPMAGAAVTIAFYSLGRHGRSAWLTVVTSAVAYVTVYTLAGSRNQAGIVVQILVAVCAGRLFRLRHRLGERRRRRAAEAAVRAERRRIARELHDVVAHHITTINVLVGAGRTTMAADPAAAEEAFLTAERTARRAMAEMRELLHVLRADDAPEAVDHAGIGAARLPVLVERSGVTAELVVTGEAVPLPTVVDHAVYRIVQEALTNVRKHAHGARATVRLSYLPERVEVEVTDDGTAAVAGRHGGYGLKGMAERVALCGGVLRTGRRPEGGFQVHALLPVTAPEETGG
jgi:signal transduction histidine kinase